MLRWKEKPLLVGVCGVGGGDDGGGAPCRLASVVVPSFLHSACLETELQSEETESAVKKKTLDNADLQNAQYYFVHNLLLL